MSAQKSPDDLDALRIVIEAVKDFKQDDQKRIFRWAAEKLGLHQSFESPGVPPTQMHQSSSTPAAALQHTPPQDIKSFVAAKSPRNDVQFAATVAYYFQFEAPPSERKQSINGDDLQDACRKAGRDRLRDPGQTLRNAHHLGLLDKAGEPGSFSVNTVGENLVAMTLPGDSNSSGKAKRTRKKTSKRAKKRAANKKAAKKKAGRKGAGKKKSARKA